MPNSNGRPFCVSLVLHTDCHNLNKTGKYIGMTLFRAFLVFHLSVLLSCFFCLYLGRLRFVYRRPDFLPFSSRSYPVLLIMTYQLLYKPIRKY